MVFLEFDILKKKVTILDLCFCATTHTSAIHELIERNSVFFKAVLLLALFAVAMASDTQPAKEEVATKPSVDEAVRDKRGAIIVNPYAPISYAYSPYAYNSYLPYAYHPYAYRYSYPYGLVYG